MIRNTIHIIYKEVNSYFNTLIAYVLIVSLFIFVGFYMWLFKENIFYQGQASMDMFFKVAYWTFFFFIPAITMRSIALEKKNGTLELLQTKPISSSEIILGKFLACMTLIALILLLSMVYYITIWSVGNVNHSEVWLGYLGLFLSSGAYVGIGILSSSLFKSQVAAFLLALSTGTFLHFIFGEIALNTKEKFTFISKTFDYLSLKSHYFSLIHDVVSTSDIVYFLSIIFVSLYISRELLKNRAKL